jgi:thiamine biosynthesis lipoprotein
MALVAQMHSAGAPQSFSSAGGATRKVAFFAMGTPCEIQYVCDDDTSADLFARTARGWVERFEAKYSRFRPTSLISRINAAAGDHWVDLDAEAEQIFKLCDTVYFLSQGIIDPTTLPLMRLWDYKAQHPTLPSETAIAHARRLVGWSRVQRIAGKIFLPERGMALDLGGFGKEYAVDVVAQIANDAGITDVLVDFGHDIRVTGRPPGRPAWHIGLEDPKQPGASSNSVALHGSRGIASSGDYIRNVSVAGKRYGHIVDPRTGRPVSHGCLQATVISGTCLHAGVLSTTAFVLGVPKAIEFIQSFPGAEGMLVTEQARAQTRGFFNHVVSH